VLLPIGSAVQCHYVYQALIGPFPLASALSLILDHIEGAWRSASGYFQDFVLKE
jgi:hypothetical protein